MTRVQAWQHVFTSLDRDQSSSGRRGYQTACYSRDGISNEDIQILESRSQYYASPGDPAKWQHYWLPDGRWVVGRSVAVPELDEFGRKGRYLTHNLVLPAEVWPRVGHAPFGVMQVNPFLSQMGQVLPLVHPGNVQALVLDVPDSWQTDAIRVAHQWNPEALIALARLVRQTASPPTTFDHVAFTGSPRQIVEALLACFVLAEPEQRRYMTFDTHAVGCNWKRPVSFWAQGFPDIHDLRTSVIVETAQRQVFGNIPQPADAGLYDLWVERSIGEGRLEELVAHQTAAVRLDAALRGKTTTMPRPDEVDPRLVDRLADLGADAINAHLKRHLPAGLSQPLVEAVLAGLGATPQAHLHTLLAGLSRDDILDVMYDVLEAHLATPPSDADRHALAALAPSHAGLRRLLKLWDGDLKGWRAELDAIPATDYRHLVGRWLRDRKLSPLQTIAPRQVDIWLAVVADLNSVGIWLPAARALADCCGGPGLERLADLVPIMSQLDQTKLAEWLRKSWRGRTPRLQAALDRLVPRAPSWLDRLKDALLGPETPPSPRRGSHPTGIPSRRDSPTHRDRRR